MSVSLTNSKVNPDNQLLKKYLYVSGIRLVDLYAFSLILLTAFRVGRQVPHYTDEQICSGRLSAWPQARDLGSSGASLGNQV